MRPMFSPQHLHDNNDNVWLDQRLLSLLFSNTFMFANKQTVLLALTRNTEA